MSRDNNLPYTPIILTSSSPRPKKYFFSDITDCDKALHRCTDTNRIQHFDSDKVRGRAFAFPGSTSRSWRREKPPPSQNPKNVRRLNDAISVLGYVALSLFQQPTPLSTCTAVSVLNRKSHPGESITEANAQYVTVWRTRLTRRHFISHKLILHQPLRCTAGTNICPILSLIGVTKFYYASE